MRERSGAGASVSSGASYQARVGAYIVACQICGADMGADIALHDEVAKVSFETMEDVDDINVHLNDGSTSYIQAKAIITFSLSEKGDLRSVLDQFQQQRCGPDDRLILVTSSRSSKKATYDLRSALNAYRHAEEKAFYRTQPRALSKIVDELKTTFKELDTQGDIDQILKRMSVIVLDIEENDPIEQAMVLIFKSHGFAAPRAVWGKLVSDCVTFSKSRRTIDIAQLTKSYGRFLCSEASSEGDTVDEVMKFEIGSEFSTGREVVLLESDGAIFTEGFNIVEFYRFDDDCNDRIRFNEDQVTLGDGSVHSLLRRSATFEGMTRLIESDDTLCKGGNVTIRPANLADDIEETPCAKMHKERLERAIADNKELLCCLHCGKPVFSTVANVVELEPTNAPVVGLSHYDCLQPSDRVLGTIKSDAFDSYPELIDFDVIGWFKAAHGGQMVFNISDQLPNPQQNSILWGGGEAKGPQGNYVIEVSLLNGEREIVTKRNNVQRFSREDANEFAEKLNSYFDEARARSDPLCYSDETKSFGPKSQLLGVLGMKEELRPVDHARVRNYDANFADRFSIPGHWYAPLLYLYDPLGDAPISHQDSVFLLTDPLTLGRYLDNWREAEIDVEEYRTEALLNDDEFDDFMRWNEERGCSAIVNPLFDSATADLISGRPLTSLDRFKPQ